MKEKVQIDLRCQESLFTAAGGAALPEDVLWWQMGVLSCVTLPSPVLLIFEKWESVWVCNSQGIQESSGCI